MYHTYGGPFAITDIDQDGHKEIVTAYFPRGIGLLPSMAFFECLGPRRYRFYNTNIGFQRPLFRAIETDINHNGIKELTVLTSDPSLPVDPTLIHVSEFVSKGPGPNGYMMAFNQQLARFQGYSFNLTVGQVDGQGWDEIIPAGGSFGFMEPVPVQYLWYSGLPSPNDWITRGIYTGLQSGTGAVMFVNLDADTTLEFVSAAPGPIGHGSMYALKYQHDTTWSVMWADSSLENSPLWLNSGILNGQFVVAGANTWDLSPLDTFYSRLNVYQPPGSQFGVWRRDSISIQQFHLLDTDHDGRTNLIFAQVAPYNHRLNDYESDTTVVGVGPSGELPKRFALLQNYPNPFNPMTHIGFVVPRGEQIRLSVFDLLGREVVVLLNERKPPGTYTIEWDATGIASGVYFYQLRTQGQIITRKMLLLR